MPRLCKRARQATSPVQCAVCGRQRRGRAHALAALCGVASEALVQRLCATPTATRVCDRCYTALRRALINDEPVLLPSRLGAQAGLGLFAERDYRRGARVTRYGGRLLDVDASRRLPVTTHVRNVVRRVIDIDGASGYRTCAPAAREQHAFGLASLVNTLFADDESGPVAQGGVHLSARQINCEFRRVWDARTASHGVWLIATRAVRAGDELYASYGRDYESMNATHGGGGDRRLSKRANPLAWQRIAPAAKSARKAQSNGVAQVGKQASHFDTIK